MIKHIVSLCMIGMSLIFSVSFAETIYCPIEINGTINNYDDQWKFSATYTMSTRDGVTREITSPFKPPLTLEDIPLTIMNYTGKRSAIFKTMNFTFNQGIGIETYIQSFPANLMSKTIKLICKAAQFTAVEPGKPGWITSSPDINWEGVITAEKTVTNYSACMILNTVPESFDCN